MAEVKKFCTSCGTPLEPGDKFCGSCGKQVSGAAAVPPITTSSPIVENRASPAPALVTSTSGETLHGIIPAVSRKKGLLSVEGFSVIVTDKRMIFALVTNEMVKEEAKKAGKEGFLAGMLGAATVGYTIHKRYFTMSPDDALKENPGNFAIALSGIRKIKIEPGKEIKRGRDEGIIHQHNYENGKFEIETTGGDYKFALPNSSYQAAQDAVRNAGLL